MKISDENYLEMLSKLRWRKTMRDLYQQQLKESLERARAERENFPVLYALAVNTKGKDPAVEKFQGNIQEYKKRVRKWTDFIVWDIYDTEEEANKHLEEIKQHPFSSRKRFLIFKKNDYKCQMCGISARGGERLEIDHIIPRSKGGNDNDDNLQVLCFRCNRGKRATFQ